MENCSLSQWNRWVAIDIHVDQSSPLTKKWSQLHQGPGEAFAESERLWVACLAEEARPLSLLKVVMNLLLEGLDPFKRYSYMIYMSVGGLCWWIYNMRSMKGSAISFLDWAVWIHPCRWSQNVFVLFYNLGYMLMLDRRVLGRGYSGFNVLLFTFWLDCEEYKLCSVRYYFAEQFWWDNSQNFLWYIVETTPE